MTGEVNDSVADIWSRWLLERRDADDPLQKQAVGALIGRYIERLLDAARLEPG